MESNDYLLNQKVSFGRYLSEMLHFLEELEERNLYNKNQ